MLSASLTKTFKYIFSSDDVLARFVFEYLFQKVHPYVSTGLACSKFGVCMGDIDKLTAMMLESSHLHLVGLHCHVGSTVKDVGVFRYSRKHRVVHFVCQKYASLYHIIQTLNLVSTSISFSHTNMIDTMHSQTSFIPSNLSWYIYSPPPSLSRFLSASF